LLINCFYTAANLPSETSVASSHDGISYITAKLGTTLDSVQCANLMRSYILRESVNWKAWTKGRADLCVLVFNSLHNPAPNYLSTMIVSTTRRGPQPSVPAFSCACVGRPCRSSDAHNPLRSSQLRRRWTVHSSLVS